MGRKEQRAAARSSGPVKRGAHWKPGAAGPEDKLPPALQARPTTSLGGTARPTTSKLVQRNTQAAETGYKWGRRARFAAGGAAVVGGGLYARKKYLERNTVTKSAPDRVYGFSTPAIGQTRAVSPIRPYARANTYGSAMKDSVKLRSRRGNRDALGRFAGPKNRGHGTRLLEVKKSVSPMFGAKNAFADQPTTSVKSLTPTGKHVGTANNYKKHSRLDGYSGMPRGANATHLGHYKKGRDKAAGEFKGTRKVSVKKSEFGRVGKRLDDWVVR